MIEIIEDEAAADARALLGRPHRLAGYYEVGREKVREFARAMQDPHPAHVLESAAAELGHDSILAPLTFTAILGATAQRYIFERLLPHYDLAQVLHTEQRVRYWRPIRARDRLVCIVTLDEFRRSHGQDSFVFKTDFVSDTGEYVQTAWTRAVARAGGGEMDDELDRAVAAVMMHTVPTSVRAAGHSDSLEAIAWPAGRMPEPRPSLFTPRPARRFDDVSTGELLPARTVSLSRGDLVNYAGVSGDPNPIHWSDAIATRAGLPTVVAHGMHTFGIAASLVTSWIGDPGAVLDYSVRFSSPVFVADHGQAQVTFAGKVRAVDAIERTATLALTAQSAGRKIFGRATAVVALG